MSNGKYLEGSSLIRREFLFEGFIASALPRSLSGTGGGHVDPTPLTRYIFRAEEEGSGEGRVPAVDTSDRQGVLFTHKFVSTSLTLTGEVAIG